MSKEDLHLIADTKDASELQQLAVSKDSPLLLYSSSSPGYPTALQPFNPCSTAGQLVAPEGAPGQELQPGHLPPPLVIQW